MTEKKLEKKISLAVEDLVPADTFERICSKIDPAPQERTEIKMTKRKNTIVKFALPLVAACAVMIFGFLGGTYYSNNIAVDSIIDIDVNPSIELTTNKQDRVLSATAVNQGGLDILDGMDLEKSELKVAVNAIIGSMVQKGYVIDENSGILVTVQNKDSAKAENLKNTVVADIDSSLGGYNVNAPIINQTLESLDSAKQFASEHGISLGKAMFIQNILKKDASLDGAALAKMSIKELARTVSGKKIDISDIADYDADDSIWENISESIDEVNDDVYDDKDDVIDDIVDDIIDDDVYDDDRPTSSQSSQFISADRAKEIARTHAGVGDASFIKAELDEDDGRWKYEIEFRSGRVEYEYEISATDGTILSSERDTDD